MSRRRQTGFGLLEVLVAMAILASVGGGMMLWLQQSLDSSRRVEEAHARARLSLDALAVLSGLNPLLEPEGHRELGQMRLSWTSRALQPAAPGRSFVEGRPGAWEIGLYEVKVKVEDRQADLTVDLKLLRTGLKPMPGAFSDLKAAP
jgi:general secretion pathway protein I